MKSLRIKQIGSAVWIIMALVELTAGCVSFRPACPTIPMYPEATALNYMEKEEIIRTTTYRVAATSGAVITYYKHQFEQSGWVMVSEDSNGFSMDYRTTNNQPPFSIGVRVDKESAGFVEYRVAIGIGGPFAWRNWCSTLKP